MGQEVSGLANTAGMIGNVQRAHESPIMKNVITSLSIYMMILLTYKEIQ